MAVTSRLLWLVDRPQANILVARLIYRARNEIRISRAHRTGVMNVIGTRIK